MTNFAPTATPRVIELYLSAGVQHRIQFRRPRGEGISASLIAARASFAALYTNMQPLLPTDFAWQGEFYIPQDTEVEGGTGYTGPGSIVGAISPATYTGVMKITATSFTGRSSASNTKLELFGVFWDPSDVGGPAANGKVDAGESPEVSAAIADLNTSAQTHGIDGTTAFFHPYATIKPNDKLLKLVRRGLIT